MAIDLGHASVMQETDEALRLLVPEIDMEPIWIPKSGIHDDSEAWKEDQEGTLVVKDWLAEKRGWA